MHQFRIIKNGKRAYLLVCGSHNCEEGIPHLDHNAFKGGGDPGSHEVSPLKSDGSTAKLGIATIV